MTPKTTVTRRQVIIAGAVAAAATALARRVGPASAGPAQHADAIIVGHGLSGLVTACELAARGKKVLIVDQESERNLGGQAFWSLGGLFFIDSPEQRLMGIHDSFDDAKRDWMATAGFDRGPRQRGGDDYWAYRWAEKYLEFAAGEKRDWLAGMGVNWVPVVGWAERGTGHRKAPGNSVPRFHMTLGTGPGIVEPFERRVREFQRGGRVMFQFRHRVDELLTVGGAVAGVHGSVLAQSNAPRGTASSRDVVGDFELRAPLVIVASGGIGGNQDLVRKYWPTRLGTPPNFMVTGVPAHVDGRMLDITAQAGGRLVNRDRMWHYTEGLRNHSPIWPNHGIRVLAAPSSMWLDAAGRRFPSPGIPSVDTLGTLELIQQSGYGYSWFILNREIISKEFVLSGSEQNPELTAKNLPLYLLNRTRGVPEPVQAFIDKGPDFVTARTLDELTGKMNRLAGTDLLQASSIKRQVAHRDAEARKPHSADPGIRQIERSHAYLGDDLFRTAPLKPITDPSAGPLIAIKMNILTRKSLGGLQTDLSGRVIGGDGRPVPGLFAVGEAAGFGGGGYHGYRALEGTFLGGCLFTGRQTGRAAARMLEPMTPPTLTEQADGLRRGDVSSVELVADALGRAERCDATVNAFRSRRPESALAEAAFADVQRAQGDSRPLLGIPVAIKDDMDLAGETTGCGCAGEFTPVDDDGEAVRRLRVAGAVIIGKTHMPEFGQWPFTEGFFGKTLNPWNPRHTPGGSSGGSAAAVASGVVAAALGSDGAGSIRIPAAWTGLVGIKPQRGRLSTWPYRDAFNGLTVVGPLARTVQDAALLLDAATGNHPRDVVWPAPLIPSATEAALRASPGPLRVVLALRPPFVAFPVRLDPAIAAGVRRLATVIESLGHHVAEADLPYGLIGAGFLPRSLAGVAEWERRVRNPGLLDRRTRANARTGRLLSGVPLRLARHQEGQVRRRLSKVFDEFDVVITPTTAGRAPLAGAFDGLSNGATDRQMTTLAPYAWCWNVTGWPGVNVPAGIDGDGVPFGAQLLGRDGSENTLVGLAAQLEAVEQWHRRRPAVWIGEPPVEAPKNGDTR